MDALARLNPVKPPKVNRNKNPIAKRLHVVVLIAPVHKVPSQLNIFIPVGIAMTEVPAMNFTLIFLPLELKYKASD